jgi:hypothetical protein
MISPRTGILRATFCCAQAQAAVNIKANVQRKLEFTIPTPRRGFGACCCWGMTRHFGGLSTWGVDTFRATIDARISMYVLCILNAIALLAK